MCGGVFREFFRAVEAMGFPPRAFICSFRNSAPPRAAPTRSRCGSAPMRTPPPPGLRATALSIRASDPQRSESRSLQSLSAIALQTATIKITAQLHEGLRRESQTMCGGVFQGV